MPTDKCINAQEKKKLEQNITAITVLFVCFKAGKIFNLASFFFLINLMSQSESEVTQLCLTHCDPMDCSPPGSSIHGILQARILEWVAISFCRGSSQPNDQTRVSCIAGRLYHLSHQGPPPQCPKSTTKQLVLPVDAEADRQA